MTEEEKAQVLEFVDELVIVGDCWIHNKNKYQIGKYGEKQHVAPLLLELYGKEYKGKIKRSCKNHLCFNPEHLISLSEKERFWRFVNVGDTNDCWEWTGLCRGHYGHWYGVFWCDKTHNVSSHRYSWKLHYGEIPDGLYVCHHCDNPKCVNPKHLFLGTHQDNIDDREAKGRNKIPRVRGEQVGTHKLSESDVKRLRELLKSKKHTWKELEEMFSVKSSTISHIRTRKSWGWLE